MEFKLTFFKSAVQHLSHHATQTSSVDYFIYLGSNILFLEDNVNIGIGKAWTTTDTLTTIWQSNLFDKIKQEFIAMSVLLYSCITLILTKCLEKKLDGNYTRMLCTVLNKSWKQHPTKKALYNHLPPHFINHPSTVNKTCWTLLEKREETHKYDSPMNTYTLTQCWPTSKNLH